MKLTRRGLYVAGWGFAGKEKKLGKLKIVHKTRIEILIMFIFSTNVMSFEHI